VLKEQLVLKDHKDLRFKDRQGHKVRKELSDLKDRKEQLVLKVLLQQLPVLKALLELKVHKDQSVHKVLQEHKALLRQLPVLKVHKDLLEHKVQLVRRDLEV
jgi:3-polyprenyl-4-hydroxybenzoate decarboxylase